MLGEIRRIKRNKVKTMVVRKRCSVEVLPAVLGESYSKIMAYMTQLGSIPAGAPYVAYLNQDMNDLEIEIGVPTAMYMADTKEIVMSEIPEGEYISAIYTGAYSGLKVAYGEMSAYLTEHGLTIKGAAYETYLNDPQNTEDDQLMTEIIFAI